MGKITEAVGKGFDARRKAIGPTGNLKLKTFDNSQDPDSVLAEVTHGWGAKTSRERVTIEVIEGARTVAGTLEESHVNNAALVEVNGRDFLIRPASEGGKIPPLSEPYVWRINADLLGTQGVG